MEYPIGYKFRELNLYYAQVVKYIEIIARSSIIKSIFIF